MVGIFGIVNVTRDSFSDGGRFLATDRALAHAEALLADGADVLDLGAESTHPDAEDVPAEVEVERLGPLVRTLVARGACVSIDTCKPAVMAKLAALGATIWNDVNGLRDAAALATAAELPAAVRFVVMFSRSAGARAERGAPVQDPAACFDEIRAFFAERIAACEAVGIDRQRLILDPGMGFFLCPSPGPSLFVLRHLGSLREFGLPLLVSVSRKSFLGALTGAAVADRGPATLAAELHAARHGAAFVRTHDVAALRAALAVEAAIEAAS